MNPWQQIPLSDYEVHMSNPDVRQLALLNLLTKKYYELLKPSTVLILGVAGGNGLEYIDPAITNEVVGIDINPFYLETTFERFRHRIPGLAVLAEDICTSQKTVVKADLVWAALVAEYTGAEACFRFAHVNILNGGSFVLSIQKNHGVVSVSQTGIESLHSLEAVFREIDESELVRLAEKHLFELRSVEETFLPNGKSIKTFHYEWIG